jgi:hypothetical protein
MMNDGLLVPAAAATSCCPTALLANANSDLMRCPNQLLVAALRDRKSENLNEK